MAERARRRWRFWLLLGLLGALVLFWLGRGGGIEDGSFLIVDIEGEYLEAGAPPLLERLLGDAPRPTVALLSQLTLAERDARIDTVVFRIRGLDVGWGKAQEIRDAIARLSEKGRRTIAYLEVEKFAANLEYYVASAADQVWVAPGTRLPFIGLAAEYLFLGGLFEKIGVDFEYERVGRFKSAVETFAESKMSDAAREMAESLLDSIDAQLVAGIAEARDLEPAVVREAIDQAPSAPAELQALGLVDGAAFLDEILTGEGGPPVVEAAEYAADPAALGFAPQARVALVYASGPVVTGHGGRRPGGGPALASAPAIQALEDAAEDAQIDAVLLRVDSPGGSALASDLIWRGVERVRAAGKPVVASFSDVAASGGYYVACGADRVVSEPATLTGSIGVFVLRPVLSELFEKIGIGVESFTRGEHAEILLSNRRLSPRSRARLRADVQGVYQLFVARVADGRELDPEAVDAVGRGRVWTGAQAHEIGLVDRLGGIRAAAQELKELLDLDPDADITLVPWPAPRSLGDQLADLLRMQLGSAVGRLLARAPGAELFDALATLPSGTPVLVPPVLPEIR